MPFTDNTVPSLLVSINCAEFLRQRIIIMCIMSYLERHLHIVCEFYRGLKWVIHSSHSSSVNGYVFCEIRRKFDDSLTAYLKYYSTNVSRCFIYQAHRTSCKPEEHMELQFNMHWLICTVWARTKRFLQCLFTLLNRMFSKRRFFIIVERSFTTYDVLGTRSDNKRNFQRERDRNVVQYVRSIGYHLQAFEDNKYFVPIKARPTIQVVVPLRRNYKYAVSGSGLVVAAVTSATIITMIFNEKCIFEFQRDAASWRDLCCTWDGGSFLYVYKATRDGTICFFSDTSFLEGRHGWTIRAQALYLVWWSLYTQARACYGHRSLHWAWSCNDALWNSHSDQGSTCWQPST